VKCLQGVKFSQLTLVEKTEVKHLGGADLALVVYQAENKLI
jgi:hypothetical protein